MEGNDVKFSLCGVLQDNFPEVHSEDQDESDLSHVLRDKTSDQQNTSQYFGVKLVGLPSEEQLALLNVLSQHEGAFSRGYFDVGRCDIIPHQIKLEEGPIY